MNFQGIKKRISIKAKLHAGYLKIWHEFPSASLVAFFFPLYFKFYNGCQTLKMIVFVEGKNAEKQQFRERTEFRFTVARLSH